LPEKLQILQKLDVRTLFKDSPLKLRGWNCRRELYIWELSLFKFIHTADIHLDSQLHNLDLYEGAPVEEFRQATRRAFENLVHLAISEKAAFMLIAGDLEIACMCRDKKELKK
jgi:hypothetical protein